MSPAVREEVPQLRLVRPGNTGTGARALQLQ